MRAAEHRANKLYKKGKKKRHICAKVLVLPCFSKILENRVRAQETKPRRISKGRVYSNQNNIKILKQSDFFQTISEFQYSPY